MQELYIYDVIGSSFWEEGVTDKSVRDELKKLDSKKPLLVRINSPGGIVSHAVAIKTMLDQWEGTVSVQIDGLAASAASFIATAGESVSIADGSLYMIHNPWSGVIGDADAMRKEADVLDKLGGSLQKAYSRKTGKSLDDLKAMMDAETWLTADEAIEHGFADTKLESRAVACAIPAAMGFRNAPASLTVQPVKRPHNSLACRQRQLDLHRLS